MQMLDSKADAQANQAPQQQQHTDYQPQQQQTPQQQYGHQQMPDQTDSIDKMEIPF
jgi:hypothetical protein